MVRRHWAAARSRQDYGTKDHRTTGPQDYRAVVESLTGAGS